MPKISIIIPCYNEETSLPLYFECVNTVINNIKDYEFEFVLVNDGSNDNTLSVMNDLYNQRNDIMIVSLSRNFGQNAAFSAGLKVCNGDYAITMDSDLQDPVNLIQKIAEKFSEGYEVVNPHRVDRSTDSFFKRKSASFFYKFINKIEGKTIAPENVNCFRGLSRRVIDEINNLTEQDRYLRTEASFVGYKTCMIDFKREKRVAGESKYNASKLFIHAFDNISTMTQKPLYFPIQFGAISSVLTFINMIIFFILFIISCVNYYFYNVAYGPLFIVSVILFVTSLIIFFIGIIGLYLHNVLINTRNRPNYIIDIIKKQEDKNE